MATDAMRVSFPRDAATSKGAIGQAIDRWIYVFMAVLFIAIALGGFIPDSLTRLAEIDAGRRPPFSPFVHVHAVVMGSWLLLLLAQTTLVATGRKNLHLGLGLASLALGPAVVALMVATTVNGWASLYSAAAPAPPEVLAQAKTMISNVLLVQSRSVFYFSLFFLWAILVRGKDNETHKRMMILATLSLIPAAIVRMRWLPTTMPASYDAPHAYMLLCLMPVLVRDVVRLGRPHRAYVIGLALLLPWIIATHYLWNSPWWLATAPKLAGVAG